MTTDTPQPMAAPAASFSTRALQRWALVLLLVGLVWRFTRYLLQFPIWGDECFICLNFVGKDYLNLFTNMQCKQVAPLLFWWGELTAYRHLGTSELALRFLPFLASIGGLLLFWRLASLTLQPLARTLAVGFLAVAIWPVSMGSLLKPYAFDLLMSSALLLLAVQWLQRPERLGSLLFLALLVPVTLFCSFPVIFVAGSISVALLPTVWRQPGWKARLVFAGYNLLLAAGFLGSYTVSQMILDPTDTQFDQYLHDYWSHGFPPKQPLELVKWFVLVHTGRLMAYPLGGSDGLSTITFLLFLVGVWQLWRARQRDMLVLCLGPFVLGLVAAALGRYPYGGCCRLSQHVAPIICMMAGAGTAALINRLRLEKDRNNWIATVCTLFLLVGVGGAIVDVVRPYRSESDQWMRQVAKEISAQVAPADRIVVLNPRPGVDIVFQWHLSQFPGQVVWNEEVSEDQLPRAQGQVWCLKFGTQAPELESVQQSLGRERGNWILADHAPYTLLPSRKKDIAQRCDVYRWVNADSVKPPQPLAAAP